MELRDFDLATTTYEMLCSDILYIKSYIMGTPCRGNSNEYPQHFLKQKVDKKYTYRNLKTTKLLDCMLIGAFVVIRLNTVS